jgi:hypothetical protein
MLRAYVYLCVCASDWVFGWDDLLQLFQRFKNLRHLFFSSNAQEQSVNYPTKLDVVAFGASHGEAKQECFGCRSLLS